MSASQTAIDAGVETIWNSTKYQADTRPDFVKRILSGGHNVTAFEDGGRWYFEETIPNDRLPVGHCVNLYKRSTGEKIPSIWDGSQFLDMRAPAGRKLYDETR